MIEKEVKKVKVLIVFCLVLVAIGGANVALGINGARWLSIVSGLFCSITSSWCIIRSIRIIERYTKMKVMEDQILHELDKSNA